MFTLNAEERVNVSGLSAASITPQQAYVVLAAVVGGQLVAQEGGSAFLDWSPDMDRKIWLALGWGGWSDWGWCSRSCGEGSQHRHRQCLRAQEGCEGFNTETRRCNMFPCQGAVSPLSPDRGDRYLHGSWEAVAGRRSAWRLLPRSYLWLPASELPAPARTLRKHFALLATLRIYPNESSTGTVFSLQSRSIGNQSYLRMELAGSEGVRLEHAGANGTQTILIPAALADGHWHQLAVGVQQDSTVHSYLDCHWVSTDILRRDSLNIPEDSDLVVGYLLSGDLEQLVMVPDPGAVSQQCAATQVSSVDPSVPTAHQNSVGHLPTLKKHSRSEQKKTWSAKKENGVLQDDEDFYEGSGAGNFLAQYEFVWTPWSKCSVTCGLGVQTRKITCLDAGVWTDYCLEAGKDKVENRPCSAAPCSAKADPSSEITGSSNVCGCQNGGSCHSKRRVCQCAAGFQGLRCEIRSCPGPCLHGGICHNSGYCSCPPEYTGETCQIPVCHPPCMNGGQCVKPGVCSCPTQFNHPRCASVCPGGCEPGGACVSPGVCQCRPGFTGSLCQESLCSRGCFNGGVCVGANRCNCSSGWTGSDCSIPVCEPACQRGGHCVAPQKCICPVATYGHQCQNYTCTRGCFNGGVCVGPELCECPANATGATCAEPLCDPPCENGAACAPGNTCLCAPHTSGTRCQTKNCDYRFVQEPYTRGFKKLVKKRIETKCGVNAKPCLRTIAEYQTVYKTFYRTVYKCASSDNR